MTITSTARPIVRRLALPPVCRSVTGDTSVCPGIASATPVLFLLGGEIVAFVVGGPVTVASVLALYIAASAANSAVTAKRSKSAVGRQVDMYGREVR